MVGGDDRRAHRFGEFLFFAHSGELFRDGTRIPLRPQAATVLELLVERPGQLVSRARLQEAVWGDTVVDAEAGLNHCVRQVRRALGDHAAEPRFVATEPRRGYRFIAPVEVDRGPHPAVARAGGRRHRRGWGGLLAARVALSKGGGARLPHHHRRGPAWMLLAGLVGVAVIAAAVLVGPVLDIPPPLPDRDQAQVARAPEQPPAAVFVDYRRARYLLDRPGAGPAGRAVPLLEGVVERAPEFGPGHAALARALLDADPFSTGESARRHARRALELSPELGEAWVVLGDVAGFVDRDWAAAQERYGRALSADPARVDALHHLAGALSILGRHEAAIARMEEALELDPVSPLLAGDLAWVHYAARNWEAARTWARRTLELEPSWDAARSVLLHASVRLGDDALARRLAGEVLQVAGAGAAAVERVAGEGDPLAPYWKWWSEHLAGVEDPGVRVGRSMAHAALGRIDPALDELEAAEAAGDRTLLLLIRDPRLDPVRATARFQALLERLRLAPSTRLAGTDG